LPSLPEVLGGSDEDRKVSFQLLSFLVVQAERGESLQGLYRDLSQSSRQDEKVEKTGQLAYLQVPCLWLSDGGTGGTMKSLNTLVVCNWFVHLHPSPAPLLIGCKSSKEVRSCRGCLGDPKRCLQENSRWSHILCPKCNAHFETLHMDEM